MNHLHAALAARAHQTGRALRLARYRHRRLAAEPLALVLWQLGAEPFTAAALGWGTARAALSFAAAGEPRNRDLAFAALLRFARDFNPWFEAFAIDREQLTVGKRTITVARDAPQVVVANRGTATLLGNPGRRLAYLRDAGGRPAPPELVRLGRHLRFLHDSLAFPGRQLLVCLTELVAAHWATSLSEVEAQNLAALDAFVEPPAGRHGFAAAALGEDLTVGPVPAGADDEKLDPRVQRFNKRRAGRTDAATVAGLLAEVEGHYRPLVERTWDLLWRCRDREARYAEAPSVATRWDADRQAYTRHIDWLAQGGLRRTRQTPRQAASTLRDLEEAGTRLEAAEACEDPVRMVPYLLANQAVLGRVEAVDREHREVAKVNRVRRPRLVLHAPDVCLMPAGKDLYWAETPAGTAFTVVAVEPDARGGSRVTLQTSDRQRLPALGERACFSVLNTRERPPLLLPDETPWTHEPAEPPAELGPIEAPEGEEGEPT